MFIMALEAGMVCAVLNGVQDVTAVLMGTYQYDFTQKRDQQLREEMEEEETIINPPSNSSNANNNSPHFQPRTPSFSLPNSVEPSNGPLPGTDLGFSSFIEIDEDSDGEICEVVRQQQADQGTHNGCNPTPNLLSAHGESRGGAAESKPKPKRPKTVRICDVLRH